MWRLMNLSKSGGLVTGVGTGDFVLYHYIIFISLSYFLMFTLKNKPPWSYLRSSNFWVLWKIIQLQDTS